MGENRRSEQVGLAQSLSCRKDRKRLVNSPGYLLFATSNVANLRAQRFSNVLCFSWNFRTRNHTPSFPTAEHRIVEYVTRIGCMYILQHELAMEAE